MLLSCYRQFQARAGDHKAMRKRGEKTVIPVIRLEMMPRLDRAELDLLFSATYEELRRLASSVKRNDGSATLNPTALVHEAWMKLAASPGFAATSRVHFKRIAARAMRQLLIEAARRRTSRKRGGEDAVLVAFDDALDQPASCEQDILRLDAALDELERLNPRQAIMVESRFFGGLDVRETAELLNISEATVLRDWRVVKAWLGNALRQGS